eukprot:11164629-Lingulodinium_polyedra.AAC.1
MARACAGSDIATRREEPINKTALRWHGCRHHRLSLRKRKSCGQDKTCITRIRATRALFRNTDDQMTDGQMTK